MKKILFIIVFLCLFIPHTNALEVNSKGYINKQGVLFYENPNYKGKQLLDTLDTADMVKLLDSSLVPTEDSTKCAGGFYKVSFYWESYNKKTYIGYVCSNDVDFSVDTSSYKDEFAASNIPEIYWEKLALLKVAHPNWKFKGYDTNLNWDDVLNHESVVGISYIQSSNPIYLSLDSGSYDPKTGKYMQKEAGGWYAANKGTVAYYMDPRNFLDEINVFMFENLGYNSESQTKEVIDSILNGTDLINYSNTFIEAATYDGNNISPVSLAARSRQEVVISGGKLSDSANGKSGYYNFYNIGAFSSCSNPISCAIEFAKGYGVYITYNRPWDTPEKAILNGAKYLADGYINQGQNTLYLQRWNVTSKNTYSHQYMTNVSAPLSEAVFSYNAYNDIGKLDSTIEFIIPVYKNMPNDASSLPTKVNTELIEKIKDNTIYGEVINKSGFSANSGYVSDIPIGTTAGKMINAIKTNGGEATITTDGKSISGSVVLGTGDIINIKIGNETKSYRVVIYGDANGDGKITAVDYVKIKNVIMGNGQLNGSYSLAADVNSDGRITAVDYVNVKNYIMGNNSVLR